jgi:hypothetical protein
MQVFGFSGMTNRASSRVGLNVVQGYSRQDRQHMAGIPVLVFDTCRVRLGHPVGCGHTQGPTGCGCSAGRRSRAVRRMLCNSGGNEVTEGIFSVQIVIGMFVLIR